MSSSIKGAAASATSQIKGMAASAGTAVTTAAQKAKDAATFAAADASFGKGAGALVTGSGGISAWTTGFTSVTTSLKEFGSGWFKAAFDYGDTSIPFWKRFLAYSPLLLVVIGMLVYLAVTRGWFRSKAATTTAIAKTGDTLNAQAANAETATGPTALTTALTPSGKQTSPGEYTLLGLQPLAIKQAGFVGPLSAGTFDPISGVSQALRSGFRFLTLQIDYLDSTLDTTKFALPGVPTLVYRGDDGALLSANSADIGAVAKMIANLAFRPEVPNYSEPLMIYLHIVRAPNANRDTDKYIDFLSRIATALNPLAPTHLNTSPLGIFTRQKQEETLLNTPLSSFTGQTIVLCNADTSVFRTTSRQIAPADDLDYWSNMRVYLNSDNDRIGVTQPAASGVTPAAVVVNLAGLLDLSAEAIDQFSFKNKGNFVIAMAPQLDNPSAEQLGNALNTMGVNVVPLDIFSSDVKEIVSLVGEYSGMSFRPKPSSPKTKPATR
jgi:hypothetical protein